MPQQETKKRTKTRIVSVSIPADQEAAWDHALRVLKLHHPDLFIQASPLIVETILQAAARLEAEEKKD